jgi:LmbE family N-acetylglucosaminyl deacetylase
MKHHSIRNSDVTTNLIPKRILAVGAHPDDIETCCAGTLAKYIKQGSEVSIAVASDGSAGHMTISPTELSDIRHAEAEQAAKMIGADFYWLGLADGMLFEDINTRFLFVELIRKSKPDIILTHNPNDYHPDHKAVSRILFDASFLSGLPNIKTDSLFHPGVQPLYYFDTAGGVNFNPTEFVDITDTYKIKLKMLSCHVSQIKWVKDHDNIDLLQIMETFTRARGYQCGVTFAEAFCSEPVFARSRPYRQLP